MMKRIIILSLFLVSFNSLFSQLQVKNYFSITGKKDVAINTITQDKKGYLWLGTKEGVYKFDGKNSTEVFKNFPFLKQEITSVFIDKVQTVWVGTKSGKVFYYKKSKINKNETIIRGLNFPGVAGRKQDPIEPGFPEISQNDELDLFCGKHLALPEEGPRHV